MARFHQHDLIMPIATSVILISLGAIKPAATFRPPAGVPAKLTNGTFPGTYELCAVSTIQDPWEAKAWVEGNSLT